jgi:hypothetical protein
LGGECSGNFLFSNRDLRDEEISAEAGAIFRAEGVLIACAPITLPRGLRRSCLAMEPCCGNLFSARILSVDKVGRENVMLISN